MVTVQTKGKTLEDLIRVSKEYDEQKADYTASTGEIEFDEGANLLIKQDLFGVQGVLPLPMTDWAFEQVCNKLGPPPFGYLRQCPAHLVADNLNYWRQQADKNWLVRVFDGQVAGVLSDQYVPISNTEVLEAVLKVVNRAETGNWLVAPYVDSNSMHVKVLFGAGVDGNYAAGVYINNGEIGNYQIRILPFIQRSVCQNSTVWNTEDAYVHHHIHIDKEFLEVDMLRHMGSVFKMSGQMIKRAVIAETERIVDFGATIEAVAKEFNLSLPVKDQVLVGSEGEQTTMGVVNGLTFAAQSQESMKDRINLETLAGAILMGTQQLPKNER